MKAGEPAGEPGIALGKVASSAHDALVTRVTTSPTFQKSNRAQELLRFLYERSLTDSGGTLHEQQIGVEVFGRTAGYDTAQDTLVRVQASQLRKKLQQYFASEGRDEPVVIEVPKGSYAPVFRNRQAEAPEEPRTNAPLRRAWHQVNRRMLSLALLGLIGLISVLWATITLPRYGTVRDARPTVDRLWHDMFANGRPVCLVPSDANLVLFQNMLHQQLSLTDYLDKGFTRLADERLPNPEERARGRDLMSRSLTSIADTHLVGVFSVLNAANRIPMEVIFARDFGMSYLRSQNVILLGSRRSNPWIESFEGSLNFRSERQENPPLVSFRNHSPLPGERATYPVDWNRRGYCRVAFLPNLARSGNVLIISGTDMISTEAGGEFVSSEHWIQSLYSSLKVTGKTRFPYFEVLLNIDFVVPGTPKFNIVAYRTPKS